MKKLIYGVLFLAAVGIGIVSCEKEKISEAFVENTSTDTYINKSNGPIISIKGKPHRATTDRPRDGKNCGCESCFGLCELEFDAGWEFKTLFIVPNVLTEKSRVYFTENLSNFEREFGIDSNLEVPSEALEGSGINSLVLIEGLYEFVEVKASIKVNNTTYTTYGYVDVNHSLSQ